MKVEHNIETPRMIIRSYQDDDRAFCISLWCDPVNGKYMSDPSVDCLNEKYIKCFDGMEDEDDAYYLIATDKETKAWSETLKPQNSRHAYKYAIALLIANELLSTCNLH